MRADPDQNCDKDGSHETAFLCPPTRCNCSGLHRRQQGACVPRANLRQKTAVENVSAGYFSLADVMGGWRRLPRHNANLLDPQMHYMGIATAYAPGTHYKVYWALVMTN